MASASQGQSVCWIRNTVSDALTAYEKLLRRIDKKDIMLFHARFAMGDRLDIEGKTLSYFGVKGNASTRKGKVLIATQVVEQSLDLDFDVMISDLALASASQGQSVCWIRNTVSDALTAYEKLLRRIDKKDIMLFHARFAMGDRLDIEGKTLSYFGVKGNASTRKGKVLIATQVVEQSLDLDFDVMISDLAPIDLLIQRAGRLHRHARDKKGSILQEPDATDERGEPCLVIFGPDPDETVSKEWYKSYFSGASFVYPDHGKLWLTAKLLKKQGGWTMPDDARYLVESVYGESDGGEIPESLKQSSDGAEGQNMAGRSTAKNNSLNH